MDPLKELLRKDIPSTDYYFIYSEKGVSLTNDIKKTLGFTVGELVCDNSVNTVEESSSNNIWRTKDSLDKDLELKMEISALELRNTVSESGVFKLKNEFQLGVINENGFDSVHRTTKKDKNVSLIDSISSGLKKRKDLSDKVVKNKRIKSLNKRNNKKTVFNRKNK
eukprot:GHVP01003222.1.p1 GENE.GHVP01003222.1~~GHVP01003222.1.p1  ORF type:complete len:166 (+),score=33.01 GHVP01003222.1:3-500(+)